MLGKQFCKPVLVVRLRGGLGNQLFEYAAARSIALRNRVPLYVDAHSGFQSDPFGRRFALAPFALTAAVFENDKTPSPDAMSKVLQECLRVREGLTMRYLGRNYDPLIYRMKVRRVIVLDAYCQSYRYFDNIGCEIRKEFTFREFPEGLNHTLATEMASTNSVCLHTRRQYGLLSDGTSSAAVTNYFGACSLEYYQQSLRELKLQHGPLRIYIFGDDVSWARENLQAFALDGCETHIVDEPDTMRCFYLMRSCRHFVIANSTYSWWAAWLGSHPAKSVFAPRVWSSLQRAYPQGLIPETWKKI